MLELIDNGWKLTPINGNSGVYVATRGESNIVYVTNVWGELERRSQNFKNKDSAVAEAEEITREFANIR